MLSLSSISKRNLSHTRQLLDRLQNDPSLRAICGWQSRRDIPHESQFSRAFASSAASELPHPLHAAVIEATQKNRMIGHNSRHSTGIEAREKHVANPVPIPTDRSERKRDSPRKDRDTAA